MIAKSKEGEIKTMNEFDKIIGYKDVKAELVRVCDMLVNAEKYAKLGVAPIGGLLLNGEPGVGKTLMANCFINASGRRAFVCRKNKPDGEFVNEIKKVFTEATTNAPSIVFLDDMDKFANEDNYNSDAEEYVTVQSCIDEVKGKDVFVLATANEMRKLPRSLRRAGRFDSIIEVRPPKGQDAVDIIKHYLSQKQFVAEVDAADVAKLLDERSCAELESVINIAGQYAGYANKEKIDVDDIINACIRAIYGAPESSIPHDSFVLERVAYHEAGHAVAAEVLRPGSVNIVSVRNATGEASGVTSVNLSDDYWYSKSRMEERVVSILAGKAATEIVFGEVDMGANNDIHRAFDIVKRFADDYCAYGFGNFEGMTVMKSTDRLVTRKEDRIIADMDNLYARAKTILVQNRKFLDALAKRLQEKDTLLSSEVREIREKAIV